MDRQLIDELFESSVRADTIVHLASMALQDAWPSGVEEAFEDDLDEVVKAIGLPLSHSMEKDEIAEQLVDHQKLGWLVKFSTPIPSHFHESGFSFSWGLYISEWFYGEDYEALCRKALEWRETVIDYWRKRWEKDSVA